jgi:hypothetical protein
MWQKPGIAGFLPIFRQSCDDPEDGKIDTTLTRTLRAANRLLDHIDGCQKVYSSDVAMLHVRASGAAQMVNPPVK